jgi:hypothetical protein
LLTTVFLPSGDLNAQEAISIQKAQPVSSVQSIQVPPSGEKDQAAALIVPSTINYQGKLTNSAGAPITVPTTIEFRIYDGPGGGATLLWGPQINIVTPDGDGYYNVNLGTLPFPPNLFDAIPRWMGVTVPPDPEMIPRQEFQSVAYAINADRLGGLTSGDYVKKAGDVMTGELGVLSGPFGFLSFSVDGAGFFVGSAPPFDNLVGVGAGALANSKFTATDNFQGPANGDANSVAIYGEALQGATSNTAVAGSAFGSSVNRGVQGQAFGGTENWSGYFIDAPVRVGAGGLPGVNTATGAGDLYVADNLEVDGSITFPPGATAAAGSVTLSGSTASAVAATLDQFTVTVPGPGFLLVTVSGQWWYNADATTTSSLTTLFFMGLCDFPASSTTCGGTWIDYNYQDADNVSSTNSTHGFSITRVVPVVAGPNVFYWNAHNNGSGFTLFSYGVTATALFVPTSLTVTSPTPETPEATQRQQE